MFNINKWDDRFETAHTRKRQRLGWYLAPSGNDSKGYRKLMRGGKDGITALGVFSALCQYTATLPKELRGKLCNSDNSPMDIEDISEITRMDVADIRHACGMLVACGWLTLMDKEICQDAPLICHSSATHLPTLPKEKEKDQGEEEGEVKAKATPTKRFVKPTSDQVLEYGRTLTPPFTDSENFVDFYESKGWVVGNNKMKNWKASVRVWNNKNKKNSTPKFGNDGIASTMPQISVVNDSAPIGWENVYKELYEHTAPLHWHVVAASKQQEIKTSLKQENV